MLPPLDGVQTRLPDATDWVALDPSRARTRVRPSAVQDRAVAASFVEWPVRPAQPRSSAASPGRSPRCDDGATRCTTSSTPLAIRLSR